MLGWIATSDVLQIYLNSFEMFLLQIINNDDAKNKGKEKNASLKVIKSEVWVAIEWLRMENEKEKWKQNILKPITSALMKKNHKNESLEKPQKKDKSHHDTIIKKEDTRFENYTGNV